MVAGAMDDGACKPEPKMRAAVIRLEFRATQAPYRGAIMPCRAVAVGADPNNLKPFAPQATDLESPKPERTTNQSAFIASVQRDSGLRKAGMLYFVKRFFFRIFMLVQLRALVVVSQYLIRLGH